MEDALVIIGRVWLPDAPPARKNAGKMHRDLPLSLSGPCLRFTVHFSGPCLRFTVHFGGVFSAAIELLLINLGTPAFEPTHHYPNASWKRLQHLNHQMHMVGHHHL